MRLRTGRMPWLLVAGLAAAAPAAAQATIDNGAATAAQIGARLDGPGVTVSNAAIPAGNNSDAANMYGLFSNGIAGGGFGIDTGAALSTGSIPTMFTANDLIDVGEGGNQQYTDTQLTAIETGATRNVAVVTMDVTLDADVSGLQFRYQFGSDEYPDFVGSTFNDLFAILISGPGITGVENIAVLPSSDRTDINSVNFGVRGCNQNGAAFVGSNLTSYIRNGHTTTTSGGATLLCNPAPQPGTFPVVAEWNGLSVPLTAKRLNLTPGATYTVKIAVADVGDRFYDSGAVFEQINGIFNRDFGDAPNTGGYGDPYHTIVAGMRLGLAPTLEASGYNSPTATGDTDNGVTLSALTGGTTTSINVNAIGTGGYLQVWFDWNDDGDFNDVGEQVASNLQDANADGWIPVSVSPPVTASTYDTIARFRWSTQAGLNATATATNGEVEDYFVTVTPASGAYTCPAGMTPTSATGYATAVLSTPPGATNPNNALGPIMAAGFGLGSGNAAQLTAVTTTLGLDLGIIVPQNAPITLSVARDSAGGVLVVDSSLDGISWAPQLTFNSGTLDVAERVNLTVPAGGARYLRFRQTAGEVWVDGAMYTTYCLGVPELQGSKSIAVYDPANEGKYAIPGNDVVYTINVANTGSLATDANTVLVIDQVPAQLEIFSGTTPEFGGQVAGWTQTGTGLTFNPATDIAWSNALTRPSSFAACTYSSMAGYDPAIKFVCINPKGAMAAGNPDPNFAVSFRARIK